MSWDFLEGFAVAEEWDEVATCPTHGEYTRHCTRLKNGTKTQSKCPKCEAEKAEREAQEAEMQRDRLNEAEMLERCRVANVRPEFYKKTLADYKPRTEGQRKALEAVERLKATGKGKVILIGSNGCGKTMLGSILARDMGGKIYTMYEIATMIRQSYTTRAEKTELEIVNELASVPFLCIDEVGRLKNSEAVRDWFSFILDKRHSSGLPFMLVGNLHFKKDCTEGGCPRCFENFFDADILSRLREDTAVIQIKSADERQATKTLRFFSD